MLEHNLFSLTVECAINTKFKKINDTLVHAIQSIQLLASH